VVVWLKAKQKREKDPEQMLQSLSTWEGILGMKSRAQQEQAKCGRESQRPGV